MTLRYTAVRRYVLRVYRRSGWEHAIDLIRALHASGIISGWQAAALTLEI